jgi:hypothetical protein
MPLSRSPNLLLSFILFLLLTPIGCGTATVESDLPAASAVGTVQLVINFPEQDAVRADIPCSADSTVFEILKRAEMMGDLKFKHSINALNDPNSIFVRSINGVESQNRNYWIFRVNGTMAKQGCGTLKANPKDEIEWTFGSPPADLAAPVN